MKKTSKLYIIMASLLLGLLYVTPIWIIDLQAPQYPEGLGLHIWINKISGQNPNDLQTINGLNHYIGMKVITPEDIPELKWMPAIVGFLIVSGVIIGFIGNKQWLYLWLLLFLMILIAGLVDFYLWEYDYGHNLNPNAPIKVPGMTYQPPLIGTKQLLNMSTTSLPGLGGIVAGVSFLIALFAGYKEFLFSKKAKEKSHALSY